MKKHTLLVLSIVAMLIFPTTQIHATDVDTDDVDTDIKELSSYIETQRNLGRNDFNWFDNRTGITYYLNPNTGQGRVVSFENRDVDHIEVLGVFPAGYPGARDIIVNEIADYAFRHGRFHSITLPDTITTIGREAFRNTFLRTFRMPDSVVNVGESAFWQCNYLRTVDLGNTLTTIPAGMFRTTIALTEVAIPDSVTTIGAHAFRHSNITRITLPNSLTEIGSSGFRGNNLTSITWPNSLRHIGDEAFTNNKLTNLEIPSTVASIGIEAFSDNELKTVTIPKSDTQIGDRPFVRNPLQVIQTDDGNATNLKSRLNMGNIPGTTIRLIESSPARYEDNIQMVNNLFSSNNLELRTISQTKYIYNSNTRTWDEHTPSVQWYRNLTPLAGQNKVTLRLSNIQLADAGLYHAVVDGTVLPQIIVNVTQAFPISELFPDENLAKAIAGELHNNLDALVSLEQLANIKNLNLNGKGIQNLTGIEHLTGLLSLNLNNNEIQNISPLRNLNSLQHLLLNNNNISNINPLSALTNLSELQVENQSITLPEGTRGQPTSLQLVNINGSTPTTTFVNGQGNYNNGQLTWTTAGENKLTWSGPQFSGTVIQSVIATGSPINEFFPDENLAKAIANIVYGNPDPHELTTKAELANIEILNLQGRNIRDLTGVEHLTGLLSLNLNNNQIQNVIPLGNLNRLELLLLSNNNISNINPLSNLTNLSELQAVNQSITLPEGTRGQPTSLQLVNINGSTPTITFVNGQGNYNNGQLTWATAGENRLTWSDPQFSGTVTQIVIDMGLPINSFFPDENLAKEIAQVLYGHQDIKALVTEAQLAQITTLSIMNKNIKDISGLENLEKLSVLNASGNHIRDISITAKLTNLQFYNFGNQTIELPEGVRGKPTDLVLVNRNGSTPTITFVEGQGTYDNGQLTWDNGGDNQLTWIGPQFSGTVTQTVIDMGLPIKTFFPDENLAKEIAQELYGHQDIEALATEAKLAEIKTLTIINNNIKDLSGLENLKNLLVLNASGNHIRDISIIAKMPTLLFYNIGNQTIELPEGVRGEPSDLALVNLDGSTPTITFVTGRGVYENDKLTWSTIGENQLTWSGPQFSGTVTQNVSPPKGKPITEIFPDQNLAKVIAELIYGNQDTSAIVTDQELLTIPTLNIPEHGIKDLTGIERLTNLIALNAINNHIQDISMLSHLPKLLVFMLDKQVITLPAGTVGTPTSLTLLNEQGAKPNHTFAVGQGTYVDGKLIWTTGGENQLTWNHWSALGSFNGTVIQHIEPSKTTIASMFPDANFAQSIAMALHNNTDTSMEVTEQDLARITHLAIPNRNIRSISGIENLQNLMFITAEGNQITDISMLSKLPKLVTFYIAEQSVILSDVVTGTQTPLTLLNHNGIVPQYEITVGNGSYNNGMLTWTSAGENKLTWKLPSPSYGEFDGVITQLAM